MQTKRPRTVFRRKKYNKLYELTYSLQFILRKHPNFLNNILINDKETTELIQN
jgi:hypothetical protein